MNTVPIYWRGEPGWKEPPRIDGRQIVAVVLGESWVHVEFACGVWRNLAKAHEYHQDSIWAWIELPGMGAESPPRGAAAHDPLCSALAELHQLRAAADRAIAAVEKLTEGRKDWQ